MKESTHAQGALLFTLKIGLMALLENKNTRVQSILNSTGGSETNMFLSFELREIVVGTCTNVGLPTVQQFILRVVSINPHLNQNQ